MNGLESMLDKPIFQALGWTLIHFIWEGALIAILYAIVSILLRRSTARVRYAAACCAMLMMLIAPAGTMFVVSAVQTPSQSSDLDAPPTTSQPVTTSALSVDDRRASGTSDYIPSDVEPSFTPQASPINQWMADRFPRAMPWLLGLWFLGVLVLSLRFAGGLVTAQRLKRIETSATVQLWQEKLRVLCVRLRVSRPVRLCESALVEVPTVIGWLRPVILIPLSAVSGLSAEQLEALLAHELAHIRRCDYLVNLIQTTIETLLFYHPAVWWVSRQIRHEREHCCDDLAVAACGDVLTYARALAALEQMRAITPQLAVAASGGSLIVRIQRLLRHRSPSRSGFQNWLAGFLALATVFGWLVAAETALLSKEAKAAVKDEFTLTMFPAVPAASEKQADPTEQTADHAAQPQPAPETIVSPKIEPAPDMPSGTPAEAPSSNPQQSSSEPARAEAPTQEAGPNTQDFIGELTNAGLTKLSISELIALQSNGVTAQYVKEMVASLNKKVTAEELVAMRTNGVSSAYAAQFKAMGMGALAPNQLVAFAIHGVTPQFINEMKTAGISKLDPNSLIAFRIHGVNAAFVQQMKDAGYDNLSADTLSAFRIHGVTPAFIQTMKSIIPGRLTPNDLTALRIHGVTPEYIKGLEVLGYTNMNAGQLTGFRIHGVTPAFISSVREAGFPTVTAEQLMELRIFAVTPEFIKMVKSRGFTDVTIDQLITLRRLNILPSPPKK
jgi:beta-lactamase regulating signal transducer with metallopeptidase domain